MDLHGVRLVTNNLGADSIFSMAEVPVGEEVSCALELGNFVLGDHVLGRDAPTLTFEDFHIDGQSSVQIHEHVVACIKSAH